MFSFSQLFCVKGAVSKKERQCSCSSKFKNVEKFEKIEVSKETNKKKTPNPDILFASFLYRVAFKKKAVS